MWFKSDVMSAVETAMKKRDWKYARVDDNTVVTGVNTNAGSQFIGIRNDEQRKTLVFVMNPITGAASFMQAVIGGRMPFLRVHVAGGHSQSQVAQVCEALLEQNYGMLLGTLERDPGDGEVRLRVAVPYRDTSITSEQVHWCLDVGIASLAAAVMKIEEILGKGAGAAAPLEEV